jgi:hypothetical protein
MKSSVWSQSKNRHKNTAADILKLYIKYYFIFKCMAIINQVLGGMTGSVYIYNYTKYYPLWTGSVTNSVVSWWVIVIYIICKKQPHEVKRLMSISINIKIAIWFWQNILYKRTIFTILKISVSNYNIFCQNWIAVCNFRAKIISDNRQIYLQGYATIKEYIHLHVQVHKMYTRTHSFNTCGHLYK